MVSDLERYREWRQQQQIHEVQETRWLIRCGQIDEEIERLDLEQINVCLLQLVQQLQVEGIIILEADRDWHQIYELSLASHSMQAPFCDNSGVTSNLSDKYFVFQSTNPEGRLKEITRKIEYKAYFPV